MVNLKNVLTRYWWVIVPLLFIPACWALFVPGFYGASDDIHIAWLYEMHKTLLSGKIPPRFVPDLSFGFGYPLFNFVFPLPFYIAEIFHLLGLSLVDSIKALFFISIPISFVFMYLLLRQFISRSLSLAGATLYIYTPYRAVDLYIRGAVGEVVSFVFLPLILLSIVKIKESNLRWIGIGALTLSSLVLSHNITSYMFFPFVALFFLMQFFASENKKAFAVRSILMIFLGLFTSMYFWLPAIVDSNLMKYDTVFNFADHYPTISQLITLYWGYGASVPGPGDGMSFFLGIVNLLLVIAGFIIAITSWSRFRKEIKILLVWVFVCLGSAFFLMNYRSTFLWNNLPLLSYFQFPWRFLILTTFATPLLIIVFDKFKSKSIIATVIIVLTLITSGSYFRPEDFLGRQDSYFLNRYIPTPSASKEYLETQEEYLRLPKHTQVRPNQNYPLVSVENGEIKKFERLNDLDALITVESTVSATINYNKYFFPGWVAKIDGKQNKIEIGQPFGQINVNVPPGQHQLKISFEETTFKKALDAISLAGFLVSLGMCFSKNLRQSGPFGL
ncbi:MAG: Integral membrane protein-like protein [Microgenomates group bacterium Gr01-1014_7]|nr:MAG: Integral membrane protein-like protein [Microgenomates group bacterium Gr01-1014_7]